MAYTSIENTNLVDNLLRDGRVKIAVAMNGLGPCQAGEFPRQRAAPLRPARGGPDRCGQHLQVVQRGASNVYFPYVASSIYLLRPGEKDRTTLSCERSRTLVSGGR